MVKPFSTSSTYGRSCTLWCLLGIVFIVSGCASRHPMSPFAESTLGPVLLAHRGVAQTFDLNGVTGSTCTAVRIHPPMHSLLENTIESISAAAKAGAAVIEVDVHPTTDGEFAVFHDWTLECRTNGTGRTRDRSMMYLKSLDIGYGYTADGGKSFPFRGRAVGLMPSLTDVLKAFPAQSLLINVKSNDPEEGERLAVYLNALQKEQRRFIAVYGGDKPIAVISEKVSDVLAMSRSSLKRCLIHYMLVGWSGAVPESCEQTLVLIPINYANWLWGWPHRFVERMRSVGSAVFVFGSYSGGPSQGIDSFNDLDKLPKDYTGGIWTDEVELIGAALRDWKKGGARQ